MSDDLVKRICKTWIEDGRSDDCFWEGWPEDPTPEDSLTPGMVLGRIEELEAKLAKAENALFTLSRIHDGNPSDARADMLPLDYARHMLWEARSIARATLAELKGDKDAESNL
jgi:hypothetical protein